MTNPPFFPDWWRLLWMPPNVSVCHFWSHQKKCEQKMAFKKLLYKFTVLILMTKYIPSLKLFKVSLYQIVLLYRTCLIDDKDLISFRIPSCRGIHSEIHKNPIFRSLGNCATRSVLKCSYWTFSFSYMFLIKNEFFTFCTRNIKYIQWFKYSHAIFRTSIELVFSSFYRVKCLFCSSTNILWIISL